MKKTLTFNDVLIEPKFSTISSRKDVDTKSTFLGMDLTLPVVSANMDTITGPEMVAAMNHYGAVGALHRFYSIEDNVQALDDAQDLTVNSNQFNGNNNCIVSVGLGSEELERALALEELGAKVFLIDVAHAASIETVKQYDSLRSRLKTTSFIIVGNFATSSSIEAFNRASQSKQTPDAYKVGIGGGSMCTTRIVTGCGVPTLASVIDCVNAGFDVIADGGLKTSGDIAKALAAGAKAAMLGGMLSGTKETPGGVKLYNRIVIDYNDYLSKFTPEGRETVIEEFMRQEQISYRGSASLDSYKVQGKEAKHRTAEGVDTLVPYKGSVSDVLQQIEAGLRSAMTYVGARNLTEFKENATLVEITNSGYAESLPHGKNN